MNDQSKETRVDRILTAVKNHQVLSAVIVVGVVVIAIGQFTGALDKTLTFIEQRIIGQTSAEGLKKEYCELLAPMIVQLERTKSAFDRWSSKNLYLEAKIIREGNQVVQNLLLNNAQLIRPELQEDSNRLIEHYDRWLEEFDRVRGGTEPDLNQPFVFVGPKGYPFPRDSEQRFRERFELLQTELGPSPCS